MYKLGSLSTIVSYHRRVFLCRRRADRYPVVIKQIPVDELESEERKSAVNEVNVLAMLKHPNIVAYYDNFMEDKSLMIAMEYAPGGTLYEFIQERNKNPLDEEVCCPVELNGLAPWEQDILYITLNLHPCLY